MHDCLLDPGKADAGLRAIIAKCRAIVGHFRRSPEAMDALEQLQVGRGWSVLRPVQDNETRWNSTYAMLVSLLERS